MIIVLRGAQGSGKSSISKLFRPDMVVSSDQIRVMLCGSAQFQSINGRVFELMHEIIESRVSFGVPVVVDATNAGMKSFKPIMDIGRRHGVQVHIIDLQIYDMGLLMSRIRERAANGGLYVPEEAVARTVGRLQKDSKRFEETVGEEFFHAISVDTPPERVNHIVSKIIQSHSLFDVIPVSDNFWAVGDIHGCLKTYDALMDRLEEHNAKTVVLLGDYVDRGPDSLGVLKKIQRQIQKVENPFMDLYAIRGNHDGALLREIRDGVHCRSEARRETHAQISDSADRAMASDIISKMPQALTFLNSKTDEVVLATHAGQIHLGSDLLNYNTAASSNLADQLKEHEKSFLKEISVPFIQVHGHKHWEFEDEIDPKMANLDGGAVYGGFMVAYNPFTRQTIKQPFLDGESYNEFETVAE